MFGLTCVEHYGALDLDPALALALGIHRDGCRAAVEQQEDQVLHPMRTAVITQSLPSPELLNSMVPVLVLVRPEIRKLPAGLVMTPDNEIVRV